MEYATLSKFDRAFSGLQGGNNLSTKPATVEYVEPITGEAETYIVQTVRQKAGDSIVVKFVDKEGTKRLILPPKVANTIERQRKALTAMSRKISSKASMRERMANGFVPNFQKKDA
jgi:hypothetical protein